MSDEKKNIQSIIDAISELKVVELAELISALKEKFGISGAAFVPSMVGTGAQEQTAAPAAQEETKTEYKVTLVSVGDKKIQVLKELRALTNLGLKEAKDLIDKAPAVIKEDATKEEAEKIKAKLEEVGAKVEIK
ncbi:MAG: 50S ribosomal protein L7/L12 [candidate division WOR-3 bacterium]|nr:50S ribosomal protein L7/L12 [candidate division WOR-3 bacterium]MCX7757142.1 50S ribosomal protein L7/L12 [candidate division WOR-3 bacterium]MDW7987764.1 50S ribosomal protein L7/L12 [candidate division WOR-3 bacterium]